jgi:hypothetical protein
VNTGEGIETAVAATSNARVNPIKCIGNARVNPIKYIGDERKGYQVCFNGAQMCFNFKQWGSSVLQWASNITKLVRLKCASNVLKCDSNASNGAQVCFKMTKLTSGLTCASKWPSNGAQVCFECKQWGSRVLQWGSNVIKYIGDARVNPIKYIGDAGSTPTTSLASTNNTPWITENNYSWMGVPQSNISNLYRRWMGLPFKCIGDEWVSPIKYTVERWMGLRSGNRHPHNVISNHQESPECRT